jgi:DNA replication protein DnaC
VLSFNTILPKDFIVSTEIDILIDQNWKQACASTSRNYEEFLKNHSKLYKPLVVVGPSGAGKGTLIEGIKAKYLDRFGFSVSFTTRKPRVGEVHGEHYFFISRDDFEVMIGN